MVKSIDTIIAEILNAPKPVVLFDTCALLDVIRSAQRESIRPQVISSASSLITSGGKWLISSEVVDSEWKDNVEFVEIDTRNALRNLHKRALIFKEAVEHTPNAPQWDCNHIASYKLEEKLRSVSDRLRGSLHLIGIDSDCVQKASNRVVRSIAPASRGKSEFKDCLIVEHYIALAKRLKGGGFSCPIIFVSSNKSDFGSPYDIKEPLRTEFSDVSIQYVDDIASIERLCV